MTSKTCPNIDGSLVIDTFFKEKSMANNDFKDKFEKIEWIIFKTLLLISFLVAAFKVLDYETHIGDFVTRIAERVLG